MKSGRNILLFSLVFCIAVSYANMDTEVQDHQNKIHESLLDVKKQHPDVTQTVYRALDHVSKVCTLCKKLEHQKQNVVQQLKKQHKENDKLQQRNDQLASKVNNLKARLSASEKQLSYHARNFERAQQKNNELQSRAADVEQERQAFHQKIRALDEIRQQQQQHDEPSQEEPTQTDFLNTSTADADLDG